MAEPADDVESVAALGDRLRRALYDHVARADAPLGRDECAEATGIKRPLAAYHLDRLAASGLLEVRYERPPGRRGPGAGRPRKLYSRVSRDVEVTLPARDYQAAAKVLAEAIEEAGPDVVRDAVLPAAGRLGRELGSAAVAGDGPSDQWSLLAARGYDPVTDDDGTVRLRNCPFHALVLDHTSLVCSMNLALLEGLCQDVAPGAQPVLDPRPAHCCVAFPPAP
jgi:predicted ArsR family transcriptional regulator